MKFENILPISFSNGNFMIGQSLSRCMMLRFSILAILLSCCGKNQSYRQENKPSEDAVSNTAISSSASSATTSDQLTSAAVGCYDIGNVNETGSAQTAARSTPAGSSVITWQNPSIYTSIGSFSGANNRPASHEGTDLIHANATTAPTVYIKAPADGLIVYCQAGCLQSTEIGSNTSMRECGQGWGNHIVIRHGNGTMIPFTYTRLAHLKPGSFLVNVGQMVSRGQTIAQMGNTGRSDTRHVHVELGTRAQSFTSGVKSQNFDRVWNFELLSRSSASNTP